MPHETYTFRRLIIEKYGEEKFELGCKLISMFVYGWNLQETIIMASEIPDKTFNVSQAVATKLIKLFGPHTTEFFNSVTSKQ